MALGWAQNSAILASVLIVLMAGTALMAAKRRAGLGPLGAAGAGSRSMRAGLTAPSFVSVASPLAGYGIILDASGLAWVGIPAALATAVAVQLWLGKAPEYGDHRLLGRGGCGGAELGRAHGPRACWPRRGVIVVGRPPWPGSRAARPLSPEYCPTVAIGPRPSRLVRRFFRGAFSAARAWIFRPPLVGVLVALTTQGQTDLRSMACRNRA